jgi:GH25 family lysozyme M1 (1,4-beta-N-acetylmuramidase)
MKTTLGIGDSSQYVTNKYTDWSIARRHGCQFGIVRAASTGVWTNGKPSLVMDSMYPANARKMDEAGIKRMSYAWFDPRIKYISAIEQAENYIQIVNKYGGPGELGPMIDLEDMSSAGIYAFAGIGPHIKAWLQAVEQAFHVMPRIYTNKAYVDAYLFNPYTVMEEWLMEYGLVVANWGVTSPLVPRPWPPFGWDCWQYCTDAPGKYFGFYSQNGPNTSAPRICLAAWNGELP